MLPLNETCELAIATWEVVDMNLAFKWSVVVRTPLLGNTNMDAYQCLEATEANVKNSASQRAGIMKKTVHQKTWHNLWNDSFLKL